MRIIDYFNIVATVVYIAVVVVYFITLKRKGGAGKGILASGRSPVGSGVFGRFFPERCKKIVFSEKIGKVLFFLFLGLGIFLRFYRLASLPEGFHQDEASNSYEAFSLSNFGIDRNGYKYPVYPITWGSGGGSPVLIYLYALILKFAEPSVFLYRSIFAGLGCITLFLFYHFLKKLYHEKAALTGLLVLALMPWHIVISRWGLDSNTIPFWMIVILVLFFLADETGTTGAYALTSMFCALILYCYGSATFVLPIFMLLACSYSLFMKRMKVSQLLISALAFLLTVFPLAVFYFINVFGFSAITTSTFSVPVFTGSHTSTVFADFGSGFFSVIVRNLRHLFLTLTIGREDELWNYVPGYYTLYQFTFPITFLGIFLRAKQLLRDLKQKVYNRDYLMFSFLIAALCFSMILNQNINRMIFLFLPLIYFFVLGLMELARILPSGFAVVCGLFLLGSISFTKDYFTEYGNMSNYLFMKGYGQAIEYCEQIREEDQIIYSTYENLASPFITALLFSRTSPHDYLNTAKFKGEEDEFRVATEFTYYRFGLPEDIMEEHYKNHIIIIANSERERFAPLGYEMTEFGNYTVLTYTP